METHRMKIENSERSVADHALQQTAAYWKRSFPGKFLTVLFLIFADLLGWIVALALAGVLASGAFSRSLSLLWWFPLLAIALLAFEGLYTQRRACWDEVRSLWRASTLTHLAALPALFYLPALGPPWMWLTSWLATLALLPIVRRGGKGLLSHVGLWRKPVLILGARRAGELALRALEGDPVLGYEVIGFLDEDPQKQGQTIRLNANGRAVPVLGTISQVHEILEQTSALDALIAMPDLSEDLVDLIPRLQGHPRVESVRIIPDMGYLLLMQVRIDQLLPERLFMVTISDNLAKPWNQWAKRAFDLVAGSLLTLLTLPLMGLITLLIRRDSPGPAFYLHDRLGQDGRTFRCYKFRTMYQDGKERLTSSLKSDPNARWEWEVYRKLKLSDPRITPVGRFLRRYSLDELPQLFNVLKGEMSLIGPRPYLPEERELAGPGLGTILQTKPGISGLWQVSGKNAIPFLERVQIEAWYVRNWSFWLDAIIAVRTVRVVFTEQEAY